MFKPSIGNETIRNQKEKLLILKQVDTKQLTESKKEKTITAESLSKEDLKLIELDILTKRLENI